MAGLDQVPVVVMSGDDLEVAKVSLIENVQRKDLNPVEEALAYQALMDRFGLTQEQVAAQAGKNRSTVTNMLRLLDLPEEVLVLLRDGKLSMGHARALLGLEDAGEMVRLAEKTVEKEYSVREVERLVRLLNQRQEQPEEPSEPDQKEVYMKDLETRLMRQMGRKVRIHQTARKKTVELSYENQDDLEELLRRLGGDDLFA
jgi:ParB family chromosome partitioning protein